MWHTVPDVSGPNTFNLGALAQDAGDEQPPYLFRALQVSATGSGTARIGDSPGASRGLPVVAPSGAVTLPYVGEQCLNQLGALNVYVPAGCTVSIAWEY